VSRIIPPGIVPPETIIGLNPVVLLFAVAAASLTVLACGLVPALHAVRGGLQPRLTGSGKGSGGVAWHRSLRSSLVVAEVALSIVLLVFAGLMRGQ